LSIGRFGRDFATIAIDPLTFDKFDRTTRTSRVRVRIEVRSGSVDGEEKFWTPGGTP
jgi:hypothetical protein